MRTLPRLPLLAAVVLGAPLALLAAPAPAGALPGNPDSGATANAHPPTTGRCAAVTSKKVAGTLLGAGGKGIGATVSIDLLDRQGRKVSAATGCTSGGAYGGVLQVNHWVGAAGATVGSRQHDASGADKGPVDPHFALLNLPANVAEVYVETYTRRWDGTNRGLGAAGPVDVSHYAFVNERNLVPGPATANVKLVAAPVAQTGKLKVVFNRTDVRRVDAFDLVKSGPSNTWGIAGGSGSTWTVPALRGAASQGYLLEVTRTDGRVVLVPTLKAGVKGYTVANGRTTTVHVALAP